MQLISISSADDLEFEINSIDLLNDFDVILPFMSKNYLTDKEYIYLLDCINNIAKDNNYIVDIERNNVERYYVFHYKKE
jgi:hypothetical protein